jgi:hypothetical protein
LVTSPACSCSIHHARISYHLKHITATRVSITSIRIRSCRQLLGNVLDLDGTPCGNCQCIYLSLNARISNIHFTSTPDRIPILVVHLTRKPRYTRVLRPITACVTLSSLEWLRKQNLPKFATRATLVIPKAVPCNSLNSSNEHKKRPSYILSLSSDSLLTDDPESDWIQY